MNKTVDTLKNPLPDFSDPFALLGACHEKLRLHCDMLERAAQYLQDNCTADETFHITMQQVQRYFTTAAILHHQDEEQDIFPLVTGKSTKITDLVLQLKQAHEILEQSWMDLLTTLQNDTLQNQPQRFIEKAALFVELNRQHVQLEDTEFLPAIKHMFDKQQLEKIGISMAERRNVRI